MRPRNLRAQGVHLARAWTSRGTWLAVVGLALIFYGTSPSVGSAASWSLLTPKAPTARLSGVSCSASESCTAVGRYTSGTGKEFELAEAWNGKEWTFRSVKETGGSGLLGVSCPSEWCMAVGHLGSGTGESARAVSWTKTGSTGEYPAISGPKEAKGFGLAAVSCTSKEACMAVGHYTSSAGKELALAELWNGKTWTAQEPPSPKEAEAVTLTGVSCTSTEFCIAAGHSEAGGPGELIEQWNGKVWTIVGPPPTGFSSLDSVSCASTKACMSAGFVKAEPLTEQWNGEKWKFGNLKEGTESEPGYEHNILQGVSCPTSESCIAVGHYIKKTKKEVTLGYSWNGKEWSLQATKNPETAEATTLEAISCTTKENCIAVGHYTTESRETPLGEKYA
jgi:hypothetical protein